MALADPKVCALVLAIDSPGGMCAGNLDAAQVLRSAIHASDNLCVAHAGTLPASAAYALACATDRVMLTSDGAVGSVGVIATVYDQTKANERAGPNVKVMRSGPLGQASEALPGAFAEPSGAGVFASISSVPCRGRVPNPS
jgi:ClpP class serine protease